MIVHDTYVAGAEYTRAHIYIHPTHTHRQVPCLWKWLSNKPSSLRWTPLPHFTLIKSPRCFSTAKTDQIQMRHIHCVSLAICTPVRTYKEQKQGYKPEHSSQLLDFDLTSLTTRSPIEESDGSWVFCFFEFLAHSSVQFTFSKHLYMTTCLL